MNLIDKWINKNKNVKVVAILLGVAGLVFIITFILWELLFSKYYLFRQEENVFLDAVKEYYQYRPELLPDKGEIREITLEKMFLEDRIEALYAPNTKDICDTNSWVRVYHNENGEYQYYVYLKCGKYESSIDHEGPKIELNGEKEIIVNYGQAYTELGVKSVVDNKDGKLDINKVEIDNSSINTNQVGSYKVTYKIRDSLNNQTKVTRTVYVAKNLTEIVKQQTDDSNYYKGAVNNNYLLFSGMLFRIVNVNSDGTVKLISEDLVSNLRYTEDTYKDSNIDKWLNNVFLDSISSKNYLVDSEYCVGKISSLADTTGSCSEKITSKVGLLSIDEYNKTLVDGLSSTYYENNLYYLLANKVGDQISVVTNLREVYNTSSLHLPPIKPVVTLKAGLFISSGNGTKSDPYKLNDYTYGKEHDKINTRIVGEYFSYSGTIFRIIGEDKNNNVKAIMAEPLMNNSTNRPLLVSISGINNYKFNVKDQNNPGYVMNSDFLDYIDEGNIITSNYSVITNVPSVTYDNFTKENIKAKIMLASTTDLFSGLGKLPNNSKKVQLLADYTTTDNTIIMMNAITGMVYQMTTESFDAFGVRGIIYLNGNLKIKSGKGTITSPYILK